MSGYTVLGSTVGADFDWGSLFKASGEVVQKGVEYKRSKDAEDEAKRKGDAQLADVFAADDLATKADALAQVQPSDANATAAVIARAAQDQAAAGLSAENQKKRADRARTALSDATKEWQKAPADKGAVARVKAAQTTYGKTQNALLVQQATQPPAPKEEKSWLTKKVIGPLPGWAALLLGALLIIGLGGGVSWLLKRKG